MDIQNIDQNVNEKDQIDMFRKKDGGLGDIYESKFKSEVLGLEGNTGLENQEKEIISMFRKVCYYLDSLSNNQFVPKPANKLEIQVNKLASLNNKANKIPISVNDAQKMENLKELMKQ